MTSWWTNASTEQRLAQIDAAIELHMTAKQLAMNCGTTQPVVTQFGIRNGRHFNGFSVGMRDAQTNGRFLVGRTISRQRGYDETHAASAFELFGHHPSPSLFEPHPLDERAM